VTKIGLFYGTAQEFGNNGWDNHENLSQVNRTDKSRISVPPLRYPLGNNRTGTRFSLTWTKITWFI